MKACFSTAVSNFEDNEIMKVSTDQFSFPNKQGLILAIAIGYTSA